MSSKRKLLDYIRAEGQCNYHDLIDYTMMLNTLGSDTLKAKYLLDLVWFIANTEDMSDEEFNRAEWTLKSSLDKRICDVEPGAENTQTFREFILESEQEFEIEPRDLDTMESDELTEYLEFIDYLWTK